MKLLQIKWRVHKIQRNPSTTTASQSFQCNITDRRTTQFSDRIPFLVLFIAKTLRDIKAALISHNNQSINWPLTVSHLHLAVPCSLISFQNLSRNGQSYSICRLFCPLNSSSSLGTSSGFSSHSFNHPPLVSKRVINRCWLIRRLGSDDRSNEDQTSIYCRSNHELHSLSHHHHLRSPCKTQSLSLSVADIAKCAGEESLYGHWR